MKNVKVSVFYAPQPEEPPDSSASYEFAKRINAVYGQKDGEHDQKMNITRLDMDSIGSMISSNDDIEAEEDQLCIFLVSCSADGSVDRTVRKLVRSMKDSETTGEDNRKRQNHYCAIALLGHARCENSAQQMKDTIFFNGRKFRQAIVRQSSKEGVNTDARMLELQAELEGPGGFDEWIGECLRLVEGP
eukprot:CAMPEP_0198142904 /NCGR_PEP_ID=MMETSP1443-20131203/5578_1 /TAXON_ID=186043 /ORGANISM="Entomoneis sp., Strain CCMP2396" /LENGTH=188 /DNA_ID=CAMNT_0043806027 /DNA_START=54 /DNA_END=620 /DNA_ORIENTATION=-